MTASFFWLKSGGHALKRTKECSDSLQSAMKSFRISSTTRHDI
jgi:hypothetical protein